VKEGWVLYENKKQIGQCLMFNVFVERQMKKFAVIMSLIVAVVLVAWAAATMAGPDESPIRVGVILPLTGDLSKFGNIEKNSFVMGLEEINAAGGANGRPIELLFADDASKAVTGRSAAEKLIEQDKVIALTGGYSSEVTLAVASEADRRKIPLLITTGSADMITEIDWDYVFRINQPISEYSKTLIEFFQEVLELKSVVILHDNGLFGRSGAIEFSEQASALGWKIVRQESYEPGTLDFKPLLTKANAAKPDAVYMISYVNEAALLLKQSKELNLTPKVFAGAGAGFTLPAFLELAGSAAENVLSATLWTPQLPYPGAKEYYNNYLRRFGSATDYHGAEAYASIHVIADALKRTRELTPQGVREALVRTNMMTAFGPVRFISYGQKRQQNSLPTYVVQWQKGVLETVWPAIIATKPFVFPSQTELR
jgi:branched-chain amino acid transport system substrate-binding protein